VPDRWIALAGYMGAGKTTVGRRLASRLDLRFVDADRAIEEAAGIPIPTIFSTKGELWFRRTEEAVIRDLVADEPGVLALGGGAVESAKTRDVLRRKAHVVWLRASVDAAWRRVEGSDRPLARDKDRFARRAASREPNYREAADLEVDADRPAEEVVSGIAAWVEGLAPAEAGR
jgi:shikimate kinase